jgi:hypothetical protein
VTLESVENVINFPGPQFQAQTGNYVLVNKSDLLGHLLKKDAVCLLKKN